MQRNVDIYEYFLLLDSGIELFTVHHVSPFELISKCQNSL